MLFGQSIKAAASATRVFEFIHARPSVEIKGGHILTKVQGDVSFRNISFSYPSRLDHEVLSNFNLDIPRGTTVALCGSSGNNLRQDIVLS